MNICFRVDSSTVIGTGHVVRCLTLAEQFRAGGNEITFICRDLPGNIIDQIISTGYEVHQLPKATYNKFGQDDMKNNHRLWLSVEWTTDARQTKDILKSFDDDADLLIVDHYALDINWEKEVKDNCENIMVIDDLADRKHLCDFLLDQNYYKNLDNRYDNLVPDFCFKMLGPSYALLRPEFNQARQKLEERDGIIRNVLIFFGGSDASNQTKKVIETIISMKIDSIHFDIVIGGTNLFKDEIESLCAELKNLKLHCQINNMAKLMANSDLAIGGGGTTTWERCCLGLPSLTIAIAENQLIVAELSQESGFAKYLGYFTEVSIQNIKDALNDLLNNPGDLIRMSASGRSYVDGLGAVRVFENILKYINHKSDIKI